ncbi:MAG: hypothetical protein L6R38_009376 [Xanthoria sp. 2 TBL-2021]|nr:MAG: hypothetical protein L6R38_009376 [Xanthoria sp. 2 TBL-2021]
MPLSLRTKLVQNRQVYSTADTECYIVHEPLSPRAKIILIITGVIFGLAWISQLIIEISKYMGRNVKDLHPIILHAATAFFFSVPFALLLGGKDFEPLASYLPPFPYRPLVNAGIYITLEIAILVAMIVARQATEQVAKFVPIAVPLAFMCGNAGFRRWLHMKMFSSRMDKKLRNKARLEDEDFNCMTGM